MTTEYDFASRGALRPRFAVKLPALLSEGAGKTGCLLHPRSRVRFAQTKVHTSIQGSGSIPAFPAQWLRRLNRHCERSEAIHSFFTPRDGLLRFARNDGKSFAIREVRAAMAYRPTSLSAK